jgi:ABC-type sugar transport system substrate-binding protein
MLSRVKSNLINIAAGMAVCAAVALGSGGAQADPNIKGKKVIFVPIAAGLTLTEAWSRRVKEHADYYGYSFDIRDPAFKMDAMSELLAKAISDKPDVLIVHNPTVQLLARQIKEAESKGIRVVQINLQSNQPSTAYTGANWTRIGTEIAEDIVKECGAGSGKSGEVSIIPGQLTAADSVMLNQAAFKVFAAHPEIKVVSNQASDWEPEKARQITATVLQQHPNLCAIFGHWDVHTMGAGKAVKDAGLQGKVIVYATGGGDDKTCQAVEDGILDRVWSYDADGQGRDLADLVDVLLQGGAAADHSMLSIDSPLKIIKLGPGYDKNLCFKL